MDLQKLHEHFPVSQISWRVGKVSKDGKKALAFGYIDARDVMDRLDAVCGIGGWQSKYTTAEKIVICEIGIKIGDEWVWKANGAGETQIEAEKGAASDAFKRAAVLWGIGRYLYDLKDVWVEIDQYKQIHNGEYKRLEAILKGEKPKFTPPEPPKQKDPKEARLAAENWVGQQQKLLVQLDADGIAKWKADNAATLKRLEQGHKDLYDNLMDGVG